MGICTNEALTGFLVRIWDFFNSIFPVSRISIVNVEPKLVLENSTLK